MKLYEEMKGKEVVFLKVAIKEKEEDLVKYRKEFNVSSQILMDEDGAMANSYGVWSHPETFFINRQGKIVGRTLKGMDWTSRGMKNFIQYLAGEKK